MNRVEFNLLPDTKMDLVKVSRTRNTVVSIALIASAASLVIFVLLFLTVNGVQRKQMSDVNKDIETASAQLKNKEGLERVLTVQNQLKTITGLHQNKHVSTRLFTYLPQITPTNVSIGSLSVDLATSVMQIGGTADSHHSVNQFIDTLKYTTYTTSTDSNPRKAFPTVIESDFALGVDGKVSYVLDVNFDPTLFSNGREAPVLQVPSLTTTRTVVDNPNQLFTGQPSKKDNQ